MKHARRKTQDAPPARDQAGLPPCFQIAEEIFDQRRLADARLAGDAQQ
jgi:hypothetical protein